MSDVARPALPPNPFSRQPIKKRSPLAGRASELELIRYYLKLTAAGQSPHLALIGQRGVGKTSLLNGAEALADEVRLLPIRIDMNELKAKSPGRFWYDAYSALVLAAGRVGCWGGSDSPIHTALFKMMVARQADDAEKAVLRFPFALACHRGTIDELECPDVLITADLTEATAELQRRGFQGVALLIDEADCLGKNVALLQMFRNVFQTVDRCSLILAGTEAVFPSLSEVFSPIPRQFHRIDVRPFSHWSATMELVSRPVGGQYSHILPEVEVLWDLHELCGGDPAETQLYCHHMYRQVELGTTSRMALLPQVFREVLREYRANTPMNLESVLNAIEELPDSLLCKSSWLRRRRLSDTENIFLTKLRRELKLSKVLTQEESERLARTITSSYATLYEAGITESRESLRLVGDPLTGGFWKSYVEVEKEKRWTWDDATLPDAIRASVRVSLDRFMEAPFSYEIGKQSAPATVVHCLRSGGKLPQMDGPSFSDLVLATKFAKEAGSRYVTDISLTLEHHKPREEFGVRMLCMSEVKATDDVTQAWLRSEAAVFTANSITVQLGPAEVWELPSDDELQHLCWIFDMPTLPKEFGESLMEQAISRFAKGDVLGCKDQFRKMLEERDDPMVRNNLAFCQVLLGETKEALRNAQQASKDDGDPLYALNCGIARFLQGDKAEAVEVLRHALSGSRKPEGEVVSRRAAYVLILSPDGNTVLYKQGLPTDAAIVVNLCIIGDISRDEARENLAQRYPGEYEPWLSLLQG